jgi:hypothetical protein
MIVLLFHVTETCRMRVRLLSILAVGMLTAAPSLGAQTCLGTASYRSGPMRVGAGLQFDDGANTYGAEFGVGSAAGPFGSVGLARTEYKDVDGGATNFAVNGGYAIDLNPVRTVQLCPLAGFAYQSLPDLDTGFGMLSSSVHAVALGGAIGGTIPASPTVDFVPFGGAEFDIAQAKVTFAGGSESHSENYTVVTLGAGLVFNHTLTIQPSVHIPMGLDGAKSSFGLTFAYNFGAARK